MLRKYRGPLFTALVILLAFNHMPITSGLVFAIMLYVGPTHSAALDVFMKYDNKMGETWKC